MAGVTSLSTVCWWEGLTLSRHAQADLMLLTSDATHHSRRHQQKAVCAHTHIVVASRSRSSAASMSTASKHWQPSCCTACGLSPPGL